jgi:hypothetical protein
LKILSDTSPKVQLLHARMLRRVSITESVEAARAMNLSVQKMAAAWQAWRADVGFSGPCDPYEHAAVLGAHFERLGIQYAVGGAVAACAYAAPRTTLNLDLMIEPLPESTSRVLAARLKSDYTTAKNVMTHRKSGTEVRLFAAEDHDAAREQLARRRVITCAGAPVWFCTAADTVIRKLMWTASREMQWRDAVGILRIQREPLDDEYLDRAANAFGVTDLLAEARYDAAHP